MATPGYMPFTGSSCFFSFIRVGLFCQFLFITHSPQLSEAQTQLSVQMLKGLDFGKVWAGSTDSVQPSDPGAAKFFIQGEKKTKIRLTFMLPSQLLLTRDGVTERHPITFSPTSARWDQNDAGNNPGNLFDPNQPYDMSIPGDGKVYVWIGGTSEPPSTQKPGRYEAQITLVVTPIQ